MTDAEVWELVSLKQKQLRRLCSKYAKGEELDELFASVVLGRAVSIMRTYDPNRLPPTKPYTHLFSNVRWYAFKWRQGRNRDQTRESQSLVDSPAGCERKSNEAKLDVEELLKLLPNPTYASVVRWVDIEGFTSREVATHLGITTEEASLIYTEAMLQLRHVAQGNRYAHGTVAQSCLLVETS